MSKGNIYGEIFSTRAIVVKDFISFNEQPYTLNFPMTLSSTTLFDNITLHIENIIKTKQLEFDRICGTSISSLPYATNVATSFEKPICYIKNTGNDITEKQNIKNLKIEGGMEIGDKLLLIETVCTNDFYIENIIAKIRKYGGEVIGIIVILNICEGEYVNLLSGGENVYPILNLFDIFTHLENNNLIEMFYSEKIKFYCERETKTNIKKLANTKNTVS